MELNRLKNISPFIFLLINCALASNEPDDLLASDSIKLLSRDILSGNLLDRKALLPLLQLLITAKLWKEYQEENGLPPGEDPQTNYMLFLGKGNIQFENHQLDLL